MRHGNAEIAVGASLGLIEFDGDSRCSADELIARADAAMYLAKSEGRGQVRRASDTTQPTTRFG